MVRILGIVVLSLLITPLVFSADDGEESPPPSANDPDAQLELKEEYLRQLFASRPKEGIIQVVPNIPRARASWTCLAHPGQPSSAQSACDFGRELSRMAPCTRPEDCQALHLWNESVGPPGVQRTMPPAEELDRLRQALKRQAAAEERTLEAEDVEDDSQ